VRADGSAVKLSDLKGKVVLVDFWATWCRPCVMEMPNVKATYENLKKEPFEIVGVSLDHDQQSLKAFTSSQGMTWPQYFDGQGWGNAVARTYGVQSIPTTVLLDRNGHVARRGLRGPMLEQAIRELLAEPPSTEGI
jgi:peroxiredoxin